MKLRLILMVLSLLAVLSAMTGGYFYYATLKRAAFEQAQRQASARVQIIAKNLSRYLAENVKPAKTLAGMSALANVLTIPPTGLSGEADVVLDHFRSTLDVDVCYLLDATGTTIASSNRRDADSFVGQNFAFRPYFQKAMGGISATYLALGTTSGRRGAYYSHPVYGLKRRSPIGVAVIKAAIDQIENELGTNDDELLLVTDPHGVVFISNHPDWLYRSLRQLAAADKTRIAHSRQFGAGPWDWTGLSIQEDRHARHTSGARYLMRQSTLDHYPGWAVVYLRSMDAIAQTASAPLRRITGPIVLTLCILVGLAVFLLYLQASSEIQRRKASETALQASQARYRALYHHTPAMLHSIDTRGRLVSVSDHWVQMMGYTRQSVIGRPLTDFFTAASRRYAQQEVFPRFFRTGICQDIPYQYVKKDGTRIETLLSAIGDRDQEGRIIRSLAVSIDVTERNRALKALKAAKEELSRYSRGLERQVEERTREIGSILKYTPAVVYIKDRQGRYRLVNSRFEELFGISHDEALGRTGEEILPSAVATQFDRNDRQVMRDGRFIQVFEHIPQSDGDHTFLAVKFPLYDHAGNPSGVGGIATDISAEKKAQDQLRRLSGSIMANQENERMAIARGLHDELGQVLTALHMDSVWLADRVGSADPEAARRALTMAQLIDKTIAEVRGIALRLRPGVLDDLGLVAALEWYSGDFERRTGIATVFDPGPVPELNSIAATAAYRIAQESLTNVARHAAATRITVSLTSDPTALVLEIMDDGCGFRAATLNDSPGLGVAGMRERAALVGGVLSIESQPRAGTRVHFRVPLHAG